MSINYWFLLLLADLSDPDAIADYRKKSVVGSWFSSFGDAQMVLVKK